MSPWDPNKVPREEVWPHPGEQLIAVIGRGHSGTRAISEQLSRAGCFMGLSHNDSHDRPQPFDSLYAAAKIANSIAIHVGPGPSWNFEQLFYGPIPQEAQAHLWRYLCQLFVEPEHERYAWKLPETTFVFPWIARLYPDMHFLRWIRDPRDVIAGFHVTDQLEKWDVEHNAPKVKDDYIARAYSWIYQEEIVRRAIWALKPANIITVSFEQWALEHATTTAALSRWLGFELPLIRVKSDRAREPWKGQVPTTSWKKALKMLEPYFPARRV